MAANMAAQPRSDEFLNQSPPYVDVDLYTSDQPLRSAVAVNGGEGDAAALSAFGKHWGSADMFELARQANENPPKLKILDAKGYRRDFIEFHPAYHELMAASVAAGLQASTWRYDDRFRPWWEKTGITLGMGMTEKQGGTDVRANRTRAQPVGEGYAVNGDKWFMS